VTTIVITKKPRYSKGFLEFFCRITKQYVDWSKVHAVITNLLMSSLPKFVLETVQLAPGV
ncbi:MAG: hypothetical protein OXT74_12335, partial [Candidatus Poribacteria bacterium]|nr:hypothetical protein [Candidatus Poribacteria bacterium]